MPFVRPPKMQNCRPVNFVFMEMLEKSQSSKKICKILNDIKLNPTLEQTFQIKKKMILTIL